MTQKLSPQTSSFIVLAGVCLFGGFLVILISSQLLKNEVYEKIPAQEKSNYQPTSEKSGVFSTALASDELVLPDTSKWKTYSNADYSLSFKLPKAWNVKPGKNVKDFKVLEIDPGVKFYNIKIYISTNNYYVMDGLPAVKTTIGGSPALNVSNLLYGVTANNNYFTFDLGPSLSLTPEFNALVKSVEFKK